MVDFIVALGLLLAPNGPVDVDLGADPSLAYQIAGIANGEAGGMGASAFEFVVEQLKHDVELGVTLTDRWYAWKDPTMTMVDTTQKILDRDWYRYSRYRFVGSKWDMKYWKDHGYLAQDRQPDLLWSVLDGRFQLVAFR